MAEAPSTKARDLRSDLLALLVWSLARLIGITLRTRIENPEILEQTIERHHGAILVTWHGRTLIPANLFRGRGYWALISLSRDGEIQDRIFRRFGYQTIRGSTGRGGVRAVLQLARKIAEGGVLAFTPDGPRGPSHQVQAGTIFLAQRSERPVIPLGFSARPRKLLKSWDRYLIPAPFARAVMVVGEPILVPPNLDDAAAADYAQRVGTAIDQCERRAESLLGYTSNT